MKFARQPYRKLNYIREPSLLGVFVLTLFIQGQDAFNKVADTALLSLSLLLQPQISFLVNPYSEVTVIHKITSWIK